MIVETKCKDCIEIKKKKKVEIKKYDENRQKEVS